MYSGYIFNIYFFSETVALPVGTMAISSRGTKTIRLTPAQMVSVPTTSCFNKILK